MGEHLRRAPTDEDAEAGAPSFSAAMFIEISDSALTEELIGFLRARGYLAIEERGQVVAVPINAVSASADRRRGQRDLDEWRARHPGVRAEIVAD
jgi:hypothetical protein